jgi:hypothetical protein
MRARFTCTGIIQDGLTPSSFTYRGFFEIDNDNKKTMFEVMDDCKDAIIKSRKLENTSRDMVSINSLSLYTKE